MNTSRAWRRLDAEQAARLTPARTELHWALQIASVTADAIAPPPRGLLETIRRPVAFAYSTWLEALIAQPLDDAPTLGLRVRDLSLIVSRDDQIEASLGLAGRTYAQGLRWIAKELAERGVAVGPKPLGRWLEPLAPHPVDAGAPFTADDGASLAAIADWFANARYAIEECTREDDATELEVDPRRLDVSRQLLLDPSEPPDRSRTIRVGMSAGDSHTHVPFFFVAPSPCPAQNTTLPALPDGGRWTIAASIGALLPATALSAETHEQREQVQFFLQGAIGACRALLKR